MREDLSRKLLEDPCPEAAGDGLGEDFSPAETFEPETEESSATENGLGCPEQRGQSRERVYKQRWLMLLLFALSSGSSAIIWISFAPIASLVEKHYQISSAQIDALSIVFMAAYPPMTIATSWAFQRFGVRLGLVAGCSLNCLSGLVRFLSTASNDSPRGPNAYAILFVGQILGAIAQPFFTNLPAKIGSVWFAKEERDLAVVVASLANLVGMALGNVVPPLFVVGHDESVKMFDLLLVEFVLTTVVFVLVTALFQEKPPTPPSVSESTRTMQERDVVRDLKALLANRDYVTLVVCIGVFGLGAFNCLTTVLEQLIKPVGYTTHNVSLFAGLMIGCGILSAIAVGCALDRTHRYNLFLKSLVSASGVVLVMLLLALRPGNAILLAVMFAGMGACIIPLAPVTLECSCECTYPISEDLSAGIITSAGQISAIFNIFVVNALLEIQSAYTTYVFEPSYIVLFLNMMFFVFGIQFYNGKSWRLAADQDNETRNQGNVPQPM